MLHKPGFFLQTPWFKILAENSMEMPGYTYLKSLDPTMCPPSLSLLSCHVFCNCYLTLLSMAPNALVIPIDLVCPQTVLIFYSRDCGTAPWLLVQANLGMEKGENRHIEVI